MQICPAIFRLFTAISRALKSVFSISARALASAKLPPLPIVAIPSSGSITSPVPLSRNVDFESVTISKASSCRSILSVRQSLASSTAARPRFPAYCSSFVSNRAKRENASAVGPANPASTLSLYSLRIFFADPFITVAPIDTCPSAAITTESPRRTQITVVERIRRPSPRSRGCARFSREESFRRTDGLAEEVRRDIGTPQYIVNPSPSSRDSLPARSVSCIRNSQKCNAGRSKTHLPRSHRLSLHLRERIVRPQHQFAPVQIHRVAQ